MSEAPDNNKLQQGSTESGDDSADSVLSEEELAALQENQLEDERTPGTCLAYDFRNPARVLNGRLPGMDAVNESFTVAMEENLRHLAHRDVAVQSGETILSRQIDYLNTLPLPASIQSARLSNQNSTIFVVLEGALIYACVDAYFGGRGCEMPQDSEREFSASECRISNVLTQHVLDELKQSWAAMCNLDFAEPQVANLSTAGHSHDGQILVVSKFKVELNPGEGELHIALPYALLDQLRPLLNAGPRANESSLEWRRKLQRRAQQLTVVTYSLFENVSISVGELMALQAGDFIPIPEQNKVTVLVDELPLYAAEPGNSNGQAAAKILSRIATEMH